MLGPGRVLEIWPAWLGRHGQRLTHDPKVAGSNPGPVRTISRKSSLIGRITHPSASSRCLDGYPNTAPDAALTRWWHLAALITAYRLKTLVTHEILL